MLESGRSGVTPGAALLQNVRCAVLLLPVRCAALLLCVRDIVELLLPVAYSMDAAGLTGPAWDRPAPET